MTRMNPKAMLAGVFQFLGELGHSRLRSNFARPIPGGHQPARSLIFVGRAEEAALTHGGATAEADSISPFHRIKPRRKYAGSIPKASQMFLNEKIHSLSSSAANHSQALSICFRCRAVAERVFIDRQEIASSSTAAIKRSSGCLYGLPL